MGAENVNILSFPSYHPKTVELDKYDHVTTLVGNVLSQCDHNVHVFVFRKLMLHFCNIMWKAVSLMQMFEQRIFHGDYVVKEMWRYGEKMLSQGIRDMFFVQRKV